MAVSLKMASEAAGCESWRHRYFQRWLRCKSEKIDNEEVLIMSESDILALLKRNPRTTLNIRI